MPAETLACLAGLDLPVRFIAGNGERIVVAQAAGGDIGEVPAQRREVIRWTAQQLRPGDATWLAGWPATCEVRIDKLGSVLFCHATPRNDSEIFTRLTPEDRLIAVFDEVKAPCV
jgi:diadenosine tetraphosphatase ApaH/serine/threonine PP2A family protein phosphatase